MSRYERRYSAKHQIIFLKSEFDGKEDTILLTQMVSKVSKMPVFVLVEHSF